MSGHGRCVSAYGCCQSNGWSCLRHGHLLKRKIIPYVEEGRERVDASEMKTKRGEPLIESTDDVDGKRAVEERFIEVICHALVVPAVFGDREVTLGRNSWSAKSARVTWFPWNWDLMAIQVVRAMAPRLETASVRSSKIVTRSHVRTTQSMRTQSRE